MSAHMSQAEIDVLIAELTAGGEPDAAPAAAHAAAHAPALATAKPASGASGAPGVMSQAEIDALLPPADEPADLGPILQSEVDALEERARRLRDATPPPAYAQAPPPPRRTDTTALHLLMDITLTLTVELGRTRMPLRQILGMAPGSVITLENHLSTEPVAVLINGTPVMRAEVVLIGENYGIRVTETRLGTKLAS